MSTSKKRNAVVKWSGNNIQYQQVNEDGSPLQVADTWHSLGHISDAEFMDETEQEKIQNESGGVTRVIENARNVTVKGTLQQSDKDTLDFLGNTCRDKFYRVYRDEGVVDGKQQEFFLGICQFKPSISLKSGTKRPPFEITVLQNDSAITIAAVALPADAHVDTEIVIPAGGYYFISEA